MTAAGPSKEEDRLGAYLTYPEHTTPADLTTSCQDLNQDVWQVTGTV